MIWVLLAVSGGLTLAACSSQAPEVDLPTASVAPKAGASAVGCGADESLVALRAAMPYREATLSYNSVEGVRNLNIWFVEPALNPDASGEEVGRNAALAVHRSAELAHTLKVADPCVDEVFDGLSLIAVDSDYNAWYIGGIVPSSLPEGATLSEADREQVEQSFNLGYKRAQAASPLEPDHPPADACAWPEVRDRLASLFDPSPTNVSFHYYIDDEGGAIWTQWLVPPSAVTTDEIVAGLLEPLVEVDEVLSCLYPPFRTLWVIYIYENGSAQLIVAVDGDAVRDEDHQVLVNHLEVVYPFQQ